MSNFNFLVERWDMGTRTRQKVKALFPNAGREYLQMQVRRIEELGLLAYFQALSPQQKDRFWAVVGAYGFDRESA